MVSQYHRYGMNAAAVILVSPHRKDCFVALGHRERGSGLLSAFPVRPARPHASIPLRQIHFRLSTLALKYSVPLS